jgi:hypothetical protein
MNTLPFTHPIQLVLGELMLAEELATKHRQLTFGVIARDCMAWAHTAHDVLCEIVRDAGDVRLMIHEAATDGKFCPTERHQILRKVEEIEVQAREGRIIT